MEQPTVRLPGQITGCLWVGLQARILRSASVHVFVAVCTARAEGLQSCCVGVVGGRGVFARVAQHSGHSKWNNWHAEAEGSKGQNAKKRRSIKVGKRWKKSELS